MNPAAARTRAEPGELGRVVPRVERDHARPGRVGPLAIGDVVGQAAGALGDRPLVQDVGPDRVHPAATAARAELDDRVEGVVEDRPAPGLDVLHEARAIAGERRLGQPAADVRRGRRRDPAVDLGAGQPVQGIVGRRHRAPSHPNSVPPGAAGSVLQSPRRPPRSAVPESPARPAPGYPARSAPASPRTAQGDPRTLPQFTPTRIPGRPASAALTRNFSKVSAPAAAACPL